MSYGEPEMTSTPCPACGCQRKRRSQSLSAALKYQFTLIVSFATKRHVGRQ